MFVGAFGMCSIGLAVRMLAASCGCAAMACCTLLLCCVRAGPHSEGSTLLLYTLLHGSRSFQEYVLVRSDPETLLLPVLQQLYQADKARANHLYMLQVMWGRVQAQGCT
jgi:hypothetical protein